MTEALLRVPCGRPIIMLTPYLHQDEIEIALRHNGTGYVAIGWKPRGKPIHCQCWKGIFARKSIYMWL